MASYQQAALGNLDSLEHLQEVYIGSMKRNMRNGTGMYIYKNRYFQYEGEWVDGAKEGHGRFTFGNGGFYDGAFQSGEMSGLGFRTWNENGNKYQGEFLNGEMHGSGKLMYGNGDNYEGRFADNKREGKGEFTRTNGTFYVGDYHKNFRHGEGKNYDVDTGEQYEGSWVCGQRHGSGYLEFIDGSFYVGAFAEDKFHGDGSYFDAETGIVMNTRWREGLPVNLTKTFKVDIAKSKLEEEEREKEDECGEATVSRSDGGMIERASPFSIPASSENPTAQDPSLAYSTVNNPGKTISARSNPMVEGNPAAEKNLANVNPERRDSARESTEERLEMSASKTRSDDKTMTASVPSVVRLRYDDIFDVSVTCVDTDANPTNENWRRVKIRIGKVEDEEEEDGEGGKREDGEEEGREEDGRRMEAGDAEIAMEGGGGEEKKMEKGISDLGFSGFLPVIHDTSSAGELDLNSVYKSKIFFPLEIVPKPVTKKTDFEGGSEGDAADAAAKKKEEEEAGGGKDKSVKEEGKKERGEWQEGGNEGREETEKHAEIQTEDDVSIVSASGLASILVSGGQILIKRLRLLPPTPSLLDAMEQEQRQPEERSEGPTSQRQQRDSMAESTMSTKTNKTNASKTGRSVNRSTGKPAPPPPHPPPPPPTGTYVVIVEDVSTPPVRIGGRKALARPAICRFHISDESESVTGHGTAGEEEKEGDSRENE